MKIVAVVFAKALEKVLGYQINKQRIIVKCREYDSQYFGKKIFDCEFIDEDTAHGSVTIENNGTIKVYISHIALYFPNLRERIGQRSFRGYTTTYQITPKEELVAAS